MSPSRIIPVALALLAAVTLAACGSSSDAQTTPAGVVVSGPGVQTTKPPWKAEYSQIQRRLRVLGLPAPGTEKFHVHQLMHIYNDGILVPVAANIGIDESQHVETALHTHDQTGVMHMESDKPFTATLGNFFDVWGVALGPDRVGGLVATKDKPLRVFVNGKQISDPAAHVLKKNDNIVIAYGSLEGVPLVPDTTALKAANGKGGTPVACSVDKNGKPQTRCFAKKK